MCKKGISLLLCLLLMAGMAMPALAEQEDSLQITNVEEQLQITNVEELLALAENCRLDSYSLGLTVVLEADLDLTGTVFTPIPLFGGTFLGGGHKITGITLTGAGSDQGFFRYLTETARVEDLHLEAQVAPGGSRSRAGTLAGTNAGTVTGCTVVTDLTGSSRVGGVAGVNTATGLIGDCRVEGQIYGDHFVGGVAGENRGVIRSCENSAGINVTPRQNSVEISDITIDSLTNSEAANTVTDIGGIAGITSGVIRDCRNRGDVGYQYMGYNIGGIAGTQSGYLTGCENTAAIRGRKEVGGIAGQMEPVICVAYSRDVLQTLDGQLSGVSAAMDRATGNAMSGAAAMQQQMSRLQDQADSAREALDVLLGQGETDPDALLAAYNSLSTALGQMPGTVEELAATAQTTASGLSQDLQAVSGQVSAMGTTIENAREYLGLGVQDASDLDTPEDTTGKLSACRNLGTVLAEYHAGGIVGSVAMETDMDALTDLQTTGSVSMDVQTQLRAVVRGCENSGTVTAKKQYAGGIVGGQYLGLVKECTNTGAMECEKAEHVGGIAGFSLGKVRDCHAKCPILAAGAAGGIAGSAQTVTGCRALVRFDKTGEQTGAILGSRQGDAGEITGNYYLPVSADPGAIDGISYDTQAQPLDTEGFQALENLPECFLQVTVRFAYADGTVQERTVPLGGDLPMEQVPALPEKPGYTCRWEGLTEEALQTLLFDTVFPESCRAYSKTIASDQKQGQRPLVLVEGAFTANARVTVAEADRKPDLKSRQRLVGSWDLTLTEPGETARVLVPEGTGDRLTLLVRLENGQWQTRTCTRDGSYCVFTLTEDVAGYALIETDFPWLWVILGGGLLLLTAVTAGTAILVKRKKAKQNSSDAIHIMEETT